MVKKSKNNIDELDDSIPDFFEDENPKNRDKEKFDDEDFLNDDNMDDMDFGSDGISSMNRHNDLLKELTNFQPFLADLFKSWLALRWDDEKKEYVQKHGVKPRMNIDCAEWCNTFLLTYTRANNIITNISHDDYIHMSQDRDKVVLMNIIPKKKEFGIKDNGDALLICYQLLDAASLVLMGAGDGKYTKFLGSSINRTESVQINPNDFQPQNNFEQEKRSGFWNKILGNNRRR